MGQHLHVLSWRFALFGGLGVYSHYGFPHRIGGYWELIAGYS